MASETVAPASPISSDDVPWQEWSDIPRFTMRYRHLTRAAVGDDYHVGVAIEELGPGKQSSPAHYHIFEEEHVYILEGTVTARLGTDTHEMKAGDYICYPAGQQAGHCLVNTGNTTCRYVVVGEKNPNEVCVYTDTSKVLVRPLGRRAIFDMAAMRNYWDGEDTGLPAGVAPPTDAAVTEAAVVPKPPISEAAVDWHEDGVPGSARFGGRSKHLTHAAVGPGYRVGVLIESPAPGKRLCPTHYHMLEEEHALVLEGQVTLILGDERHELEAGDYVCFPAGRKVGHSFINSGPGPCRTLMIGQRNPNEVCVYPDSNKMAVGALRSQDDIFDMSGLRRYWDGEDA
ncbi:cupin domain-containing protein [Mycobacterium sp. KBS0706]|uniref:cupin domain-containing protein n=1 Tax=Mycobacterium sp. KBS0706 TaxID=2578109 RepID=UPI00110FC9EE|nr:cupin domain-containing protein [Mycobacterium sp. KBS0706]TSD89546.1 cupin domain-containing protein [Mycobacterium sp. KBS0706]